jgi:glycosyltransferase involved in cell wall biosynthesis
MSSDRPLFSVVIPTYDRAACIEAALESVRAQSRRDWECIVVDDGSTDATSERVGAWVARDVRFRLHRQSNGGVSAARNAGIRLARGEWLVLLDSDDRLLPWALECYRRGSNAHPDLDLVGARLAVEGARISRPSFDGLRIERADYFFEGGGGRSHFTVISTAVRRAALSRSGGFDERLSTGADSDFMLRLAALGEVAVVPWPVSVIGRVDEGMFARGVASGKRLRAEIGSYTGFPNSAVVQERLGGDDARLERLRAYCARRVRLLEITELVRDGRYADAAAEFAVWFADPTSEREKILHASRWLPYLFNPPRNAWRAARRFGGELAELAHALDAQRQATASAFVRERLLASAFYEGRRRLVDGRDATGLLVWIGAGLACPSPRSALAVLVKRLARSA